MNETDICNNALGRLGEARILSMADANPAARACAQHFPGTRDEVLRSHRWNFATAREALSRLTQAPAFGWTYQFALPSDFIRAVTVNERDDEMSGPPWVIEGRLLLTNDSTVNLVYIHRETDVAKWDSLFCEAVALKLAWKLATVLRGSSSQVPDFASEYDRLTAPLARRVDSNEQRRRKPLLPLRSLFVRARFLGI